MAVRIKSSYYHNGKKYTLAKLVKVDEYFTKSSNVYGQYLQKMLGKVVVVEKCNSDFLVKINENVKDDNFRKHSLANAVLFSVHKVKTGEYLEFLSKKEIEAWRKENEKSVIERFQDLAELF